MVNYIPSNKIKENKQERKQAYNSEICLRLNQIKAIQNFLDSLEKNKKSLKIVELGVGGGHFSKLMSDQGFRNIECVDIDDYLVYPELRKSFHKSDLSHKNLPFKNSSVDGVVAIEVIEHLENAAHCLREVNRVLKKDGWFLMTIPNISNFRRRINFLFSGDNLLVSENNDHIQNITDSLIKKLVHSYFGHNAKIKLIKYPVKFPVLRFNVPHNDLLADNRIYLIKKSRKLTF